MQILLGLILALGLLAWGTGSYWHSQIYQPLSSEDVAKKDFSIQPGEDALSVGTRLHQGGLIRSTLFFRLYLRLQKSKGRHIQAGDYKLSPSMSLAEIVETLSEQGRFEREITFIEGWRLEEMAEEVAKHQRNGASQLDADEFLRLGANQRGFLFPDTYFVDSQTTSADLIRRMRANFAQKVDSEIKDKLVQKGLSLDVAVTLASIVEREAAREADRPIVAGILLKRWRSGWPLEADATVQYALANRNCAAEKLNFKLRPQSGCEWWPKNIREEDLKIDSAYNTRQSPGLPPTPICNPGLAAIEAVANPSEVDYWYYLTDSQGIMHYAVTLEEHNANIARYLP